MAMHTIILIHEQAENLTITFFIVAMLVLAIMFFRRAGPRRNLLHYLSLICASTALFYVTLQWIYEIPDIINSYRMYGL